MEQVCISVTYFASKEKNRTAIIFGYYFTASKVSAIKGKLAHAFSNFFTSMFL